MNALAVSLVFYAGIALAALSIVSAIWLFSLFMRSDEIAPYSDVWKSLAVLGIPMLFSGTMFRLVWVLEYAPAS